MSKCLTFALLLAAGCTFDASNRLDDDGAPIVSDAESGIDASDIDAALFDAGLADASPFDAGAPDASPADAAIPCVGDLMGFDLLNMDRCDPNDPITNLILDMNGNYELNGDALTLTDPNGGDIPIDLKVVPQTGGDDLLVLTLTDLQIANSARLHLLGARPVVLISTGDMTVGGRIQATARDGLTGAGANVSADCATGAGTDGELQTDDNNREAGSGGGGASFGTAGGTGSRIVNSTGTNDSPGGLVMANPTLAPLRGGCAGGAGGGDGGAGGNGGGAMHLAAAGTITLTGAISSSGAGGRGVSGFFGGGGGGGSGGAVLIQADSLVNLGIITVNGGGGGEGARQINSTDAGTHGRITSNDPAPGGSGASNGGNGGDGATISEAAGNGETGSQSNSLPTGAGGGGGGIGVVVIDLVNP